MVAARDGVRERGVCEGLARKEVGGGADSIVVIIDVGAAAVVVGRRGRALGSRVAIAAVGCVWLLSRFEMIVLSRRRLQLLVNWRVYCLMCA